MPGRSSGCAARPTKCAGATIHIVLEATDAGSPPLTRYRRVVVTVAEGS